MKRIWSILVVLVIIISVLGMCSCTPKAGPSPSPVMTPKATTSPSIASPGLGTPGMGTPGVNTATIPNFLVGTVVPIADVPTVKQAIDKKYPQCTIQSVTHAEYQGKQVYSVTLIDKNSKNVQVYVEPNGTIIESTGSPKPSAGTSASPKTSPKS